MNEYTILYIGSGPGHHIKLLIDIFSDYKFKWELYDTTQHVRSLEDYSNNTTSGIKIYHQYFTNDNILRYKDKKLIFISDIRTNNYGKEPSTNDLLENYKLQENIVKMLNPEFSLLKWRCPFPDKTFQEFQTLSGLELLQVFTSKYSAEMRLICSKPYNFNRVINYEKSVDYEEKMFYYNKRIRNGEKYDKYMYYQFINSLRQELIQVLKNKKVYKFEDLVKYIYSMNF